MTAVCRRSLLGLIIILLINGTATKLSIDTRSGSAHAGPDHTYSLADVGMVTDAPYVWQEINGFCHWASVSMVVQSQGIDLDLHDVFVASTLAFSIAYVRLDDAIVVAPGSILRQLPSQKFLCDLYGLSMSVFVDPSTGIGASVYQILVGQGIEFIEVSGASEALDLMRDSIDQGIPLILGVDPYYLPPEDYDIAREYGITVAQYGGGHSVILVGYNDTSQTATIQDPGVGAFGDNFGYPYDGRGVYDMNYTALVNAWGALGFLTNRLVQASEPAADFDSRLMEMIIGRLYGTRDAYMPDSDDTFFVTFGADAFEAIALDLTVESFTAYFDEFDDDLTKYYMLVDLALQIEGACTLQYLSLRKALKAIPALLPDNDLTWFISACEKALPHLDALSDNATWVSPNLSSYSNLIWDTFIEIADIYNSTHSYESAFAACQTEIDEIKSHLLAISDAWNTAAYELEGVLQGNPLLAGMPTTLLGVSALGVIALIVVVALRRR